MHISVGYGPVLWGVDYGHQVWFKQIGEIRQDDNDLWTEVSKPDGTNSKMIQLDVGRDGNVWGVNDENKVYFRDGVTPATRSGTAWIEHSNNMQFTNVAVCTDGHVWAVSNDNKVYYRTRIVDENQQGADWAEAADNLALNGNGNGFATQVTCAGGDVMILGTDSRIFMRTGVTNDEPEGHGWAYVPGLDGQWEQITLGENGHLWMLRQNQVYRYTSEL
jgi:hypothetical protein